MHRRVQQALNGTGNQRIRIDRCFTLLRSRSGEDNGGRRPALPNIESLCRLIWGRYPSSAVGRPEHRVAA